MSRETTHPAGGAAGITAGLAPVPGQWPRGCRYIEGDPRDPDWRYCGAARQAGSSYCPAHHALCHCAPSAEEPADPGRWPRSGGRHGGRG